MDSLQTLEYNARMMKIHQSNTRACPILRMASSLSVSLFALVLLTSCSNDPRDQVDDLAVAKIPKEQMQSTNYLPLNEDKPGTLPRVQRYLVPGKFNIVMYYSPYDGPSMSYAPRMMRLSQVNQNIAVRTVNINRPEIQGVDGESPIVIDMQLHELPYFAIFDPRQNLRAKGRAALEQVNQLLRQVPN